MAWLPKEPQPRLEYVCQGYQSTAANSVNQDLMSWGTWIPKLQLGTQAEGLAVVALVARVPKTQTRYVSQGDLSSAAESQSVRICGLGTAIDSTKAPA